MGFSHLGAGVLLVPHYDRGDFIAQIVSLLLDQFTTADATPISSPRTCEPGPGTLVITDTNSKGSIAGGRMRLLNNAAFDALRYKTGTSYARQPGRAFSQMFLPGTSGISTALALSKNNVDTTSAQWVTGYQYQNRTDFVRVPGTAVDLGFSRHGDNARLTVVLRSTGSFILTYNRLLYVENSSDGANLWLTANNRETLYEIENLRIADLPAPWTDDWGIVTNRIANASVNDTTVQIANGIIEATWTVINGAIWDLQFRRTDDNNCWIVRFDDTNNNVKLFEKQGGSETQRGSTFSKTLTPGNATRVHVTCDNAGIYVIVDDVKAITYTSATFNQTVTGVKTTQAVVNLATWPLLITGAGLTALDQLESDDGTPWTRQGIVMQATLAGESGSVFEPCVIYEGNPQILAGANVFKMWYTGTNAIFYAESLDGLTWTKRATSIVAAHYRPSIMKDGSTYYLYCATLGHGQIDLYTSANGVTFVLDTAAVLTPGVAWETTNVANTHVWKDGVGDYKMLYEADSWQIGLATAPAPAGPWTKSASNPVLPPQTGGASGGPWVIKDGGTYYCWHHRSMNGVQPTDIYLYSSADAVTWTPVKIGPVLWRATTDEQRTSPSGQVSDACVVIVGDTAYIFYAAGDAAGTSQLIKLATAPSNQIYS